MEYILTRSITPPKNWWPILALAALLATLVLASSDCGDNDVDHLGDPTHTPWHSAEE